MDQESQDWRELMMHRLSRRTVLRGSLLGGVGLAAAALIGCGDDDDDDDDDDAVATATATPTAAVAAGDDDDDDDDDDAAVAPAIPQAILDMNAQSELDGAPYPYAYVDPPGEPKEGGVLKVGVTFDVGSWDINKGVSGGTTTVPDAI